MSRLITLDAADTGALLLEGLRAETLKAAVELLNL